MNGECHHCPDAAAYLSDELSPREQADFEAHIAICAQCHAAVESTRSLIGRLRCVPHVEPAEDLVPLILARLREEPRELARPARWPRVAAIAALVTFLTGGALFTYFKRSAPPTQPIAGVRDAAYASQCLARVACTQGDIPAARTALNESAQIFRQTRDKRGIAESLAGFAKVARAQGDAKRAARLFGAAESLHKIVGPRLSPADHHDHARVVAEVCSALNEDTFAAAWAEGRAMSWGKAVAYALDESELP